MRLIDSLLLEAADRFGTPTYVYDLDAISAQLARLKSAVPLADVRYAVKANPSHAVLRHLSAAGIGAEAITLGEVERALRAGFPASKILIGGPGQSVDLRHHAKAAGVALVSLDSHSQVDLWPTEDTSIRYLVRINPDLEAATHPFFTTGARSSKFGLPVAEAIEVAAHLLSRGSFAGFHVHVGSQIREVEIYLAVLDLLRPLYDEFSSAEFVNIGGGFAVPDFPIEKFGQLISEFAAEFDVVPIVEPGRFLVASSGVLLASVLHVKDGETRHVIADAGMADFMRPALYGARHRIRLVGADHSGETEAYEVDGPLCQNADQLGTGVQLRHPQPGNILAVEEVGAYGFAMASNYVSSLRPAEVVVSGGRLGLARRRETVDDLSRLEADPFS